MISSACRGLAAAIFMMMVTGAMTSSETPVIHRDKQAGVLYVHLPDLGGVVNITMSIWNDDGKTEKAFIPKISGDGTWKTVFGDIVENGIIYFLIVYQYSVGSYTHGGYHHFFDYQGQTSTHTPASSLGSERFLRRRATTVFHDDFSSGSIDPRKWRHDIMAVGATGTFEMWTPEAANSYVKNGVLYIKPTFTEDHFGHDILNHGTIDVSALWGKCDPNWGVNYCVTHGTGNRPIMSARMRSNGAIRYGKVMVEAQMPLGDWLWPAIWMMPQDNVYGGWPRSGEIDIMEATGNLHLLQPNGLSYGPDCDQATIHYGSSGESRAHKWDQYRIQGTNFGEDFHTYWLDWTEDYIKLGVDSHTVLVVPTPAESFWNDSGLQGTNIWEHGGKNAPFDQSFYLILNVAVGGGFFYDSLVHPPYARPWTNRDPDAHRQFWQARHLWGPTWNGEDVALKVRSVTMMQY